MAGDETILNNTATGTTRSSKDIEIPKLRSSALDEYRRWKRDVDLWMEFTQIEKNRQASHMILCRIQHAEIKDVVATIPKERRNTDEGMKILLEVLDKHFMPNTFSRKIEVWSNLVKTEETIHNPDRIYQEDAKVENGTAITGPKLSGRSILRCIIICN